MSRGPVPKPTELKVLEGNRGHRPLDLSQTFRPEVGLPSIPRDLSADAKKVWKRLSAELLQYNLMSVVYSDLFEDLCETVATVKLLRRSIRARQAVLRSEGRDEAEAFEVKTPNGMPVQHPSYQTFKAERAHMHSCLGKFGLSPAEQARVTTAVRAQLKLFEGSGQAPGPEKPGPSAPALGLLKDFSDF